MADYKNGDMTIVGRRGLINNRVAGRTAGAQTTTNKPCSATETPLQISASRACPKCSDMRVLTAKQVAEARRRVQLAYIT